jgi:hypothetical protein
MELHPEALKLVDEEGSALVGTEFVGWWAPNCHRELSIVVLPDKQQSRRPGLTRRRAPARLTNLRRTTPSVCPSLNIRQGQAPDEPEELAHRADYQPIRGMTSALELSVGTTIII